MAWLIAMAVRATPSTTPARSQRDWPGPGDWTAKSMVAGSRANAGQFGDTGCRIALTAKKHQMNAATIASTNGRGVAGRRAAATVAIMMSGNRIGVTSAS